MINKTSAEVNKYKIRYLARRLLNCIAATICGEKPASIVAISNNCGKLLSLWNEFGHSIFYGSNINYYEFRRTDRNITVLFFNYPKLEEILGKKEVKQFLLHLGYSIDNSIENLLNSIKERYNSYFNFCPFPHEIGLFLGIPLKDVKGFMGLSPLPYTMTYRWKIYGNPETSLKFVESYKKSEDDIKKKIRLKEDPLQLITGKSI